MAYFKLLVVSVVCFARSMVPFTGSVVDDSV